ncbi:efflux RND transporter periplasmic adaptor subunit [Stieleria sp. JC731]|uniref:efflux RND transporter periplasmic adaptor subunit n=1 Tax=Pirellulaceae TaxID=2691357 RepID=UPI001E435D8E|nr:efflux RND transporter periplasmic adaptor subunit [Stieleria sp. JC731]MCC9599137.1 efflux RND transporter periplasmic adaptor subunit [Stieleria sp. JC731]
MKPQRSHRRLRSFVRDHLLALGMLVLAAMLTAFLVDASSAQDGVATQDAPQEQSDADPLALKSDTTDSETPEAATASANSDGTDSDGASSEMANDEAPPMPTDLEPTSASDKPSEESEPSPAPQQTPPAGPFSGAHTTLIQDIKIASPISGIVQSVEIKPGQAITKGTLLVRLDDQLAKQEMAASKAALKKTILASSSESTRRAAQQELELRNLELHQAELANESYAGVVSDLEIRKLKMQVQKAAYALDQAEQVDKLAHATTLEMEAQLKLSESKLQRHFISSIADGTVIDLNVQAGEWVQSGQPIARVISLDPIRVVCEVDGSRSAEDWLGRKVVFVQDTNHEAEDKSLPPRSISGEITFVSPESNPVSGKVQAWATMQNPNGLMRSGVPGRLRLE